MSLAMVTPRANSRLAASGMSEMSTEEMPVGRTKQISEHTSVTRPTVVPI